MAKTSGFHFIKIDWVCPKCGFHRWIPLKDIYFLPYKLPWKNLNMKKASKTRHSSRFLKVKKAKKKLEDPHKLLSHHQTSIYPVILVVAPEDEGGWGGCWSELNGQEYCLTSIVWLSCVSKFHGIPVVTGSFIFLPFSRCRWIRRRSLFLASTETITKTVIISDIHQKIISLLLLPTLTITLTLKQGQMGEGLVGL